MSSVRSFLQQNDLSPKRSLGQNFLVDETYLDRIISAAELTPDDTVMEIGPGLGGLTKRLAQAANQLIAIELDNRLIELLRAEFADQPHVNIVHADILDVSLPSLLANNERSASEQPAPAATASDLTASDLTVANGATASAPTIAASPAHSYKVVANLPYYITNAVLRHLLESETPPTSAVVMVQKEVAQRVCAAPGKLSLLAVSVQFYARPTLVHHVPAGAFYPRPKVDSAILHLDIFPKPVLAHVAPKKFFRIVKAGFGQKRKQLLNSLSSGLGKPKDEIAAIMATAGIDPKRRAETLTIPEWGLVYDSIEAFV